MGINQILMPTIQSSDIWKLVKDMILMEKKCFESLIAIKKNYYTANK